MLVTTEQIKNQLVPRLENKLNAFSTETSTVGSLSAVVEAMSETYVTHSALSAAMATVSGGGLSHYIGSDPPANFNGLIFKTIT